MSTQIKYTDRQVRDNHAQFEDLVIQYLEGYTGEFEYLIDCKMRVAQGMSLSIGMIRGVLNCMRNDPRIEADMPEPVLYPENVVEFEKPKPRQIRSRRRECTITDFHPAHGGDDIYYCSGKYEINRVGKYFIEARIKEPYSWLVAKTGQLIHQIESAQVMWLPHAHEWGFVGDLYIPSSGQYNSGQIHYKTLCETHIINGIQITEVQADELVVNRSELDCYLDNPPPSQRKQLILCGRCSVATQG